MRPFESRGRSIATPRLSNSQRDIKPDISDNSRMVPWFRAWYYITTAGWLGTEGAGTGSPARKGAIGNSLSYDGPNDADRDVAGIDRRGRAVAGILLRKVLHRLRRDGTCVDRGPARTGSFVCFSKPGARPGRAGTATHRNGKRYVTRMASMITLSGHLEENPTLHETVAARSGTVRIGHFTPFGADRGGCRHHPQS